MQCSVSTVILSPLSENQAVIPNKDYTRGRVWQLNRHLFLQCVGIKIFIPWPWGRVPSVGVSVAWEWAALCIASCSFFGWCSGCRDAFWEWFCEPYLDSLLLKFRGSNNPKSQICSVCCLLFKATYEKLLPAPVCFIIFIARLMCITEFVTAYIIRILKYIDGYGSIFFSTAENNLPDLLLGLFVVHQGKRLQTWSLPLCFPRDCPSALASFDANRLLPKQRVQECNWMFVTEAGLGVCKSCCKFSGNSGGEWPHFLCCSCKRKCSIVPAGRGCCIEILSTVWTHTL